jgi:hypothetical protein
MEAPAMLAVSRTDEDARLAAYAADRRDEEALAVILRYCRFDAPDGAVDALEAILTRYRSVNPEMPCLEWSADEAAFAAECEAVFRGRASA